MDKLILKETCDKIRDICKDRKNDKKVICLKVKFPAQRRVRYDSSVDHLELSGIYRMSQVPMENVVEHIVNLAIRKYSLEHCIAANDISYTVEVNLNEDSIDIR